VIFYGLNGIVHNIINIDFIADKMVFYYKKIDDILKEKDSLSLLF